MTSSRTDSALVDVTMPQMGVSVAEGTVVGWRVEVGDRIGADQAICDISTDKIDTEVPAPVAGVVAEILVPVDETVDVGTVLARIATAGSGAAPDAPPATPEPSVEPQVVPSNGAGNGAAGTPPAAGDLRRYSPVVQRIAAEHGIDLSQVEGTGRGGRVRKQDVLALVEDGGGAAAPAIEDPPLHIESPYRPDPVPAVAAAPAAPAVPACCGGQWTALADAPADRRAHEALAGDRRDLHDLDRGRHVPRRSGPQAARRDRAGVRVTGRDRCPA